LAILTELKESVGNQERQLESLSSSIEASGATLRNEIDEAKQSFQTAVTTKYATDGETLRTSIGTVERMILDSLSHRDCSFVNKAWNR
jgi:hypothetical protein